MLKLKDVFELFKNNQSRISICEPLLGDHYVYGYYNQIEQQAQQYMGWNVLAIKSNPNSLEVFIERG